MPFGIFGSKSSKAPQKQPFLRGRKVTSAPEQVIENAGGVWFKVQGLVANGQRAVVRRASVNGSNAQIAIKVLPNEKDGKGTVLPREVLAMRMCEHPSVLAVKQVFYDTRHTFVCMVLYEGGNVLDRTLETGGIAEEDAVIVVEDVLSALEHIHSRGIVHAAVEPSNIYLVSGDPLSPNFNHAVLGGLQRAKAQVLKMESEPGDLRYVSPELVDKFGRVTGIEPAADLWSLGATLYTMLSASPPFIEKSNAALPELIKAGDFKFVSPFWDLTSRLAKDFIRCSRELACVAKDIYTHAKNERFQFWCRRLTSTQYARTGHDLFSSE
jgi:serine/threonine protein kinase